MCLCVCSLYRVSRVVSEVDFGKSHVDDQYFHAHNAALIAVLVLGNNGHLGFSCALIRGEDKILLCIVRKGGLVSSSHLCPTKTTQLFICLFIISLLKQPLHPKTQPNMADSNLKFDSSCSGNAVLFWIHER